MLDRLKNFSTNYARAVSAVTAVLTLILAAFTLLYLKGEYEYKYRPYLVPEVKVEPFADKTGYSISIVPRNVGSQPCEAKLTAIRLIIGDETYETPSFQDWVLVAPQLMELRVPIGHVNQTGIQRIREGRYRSNRIEVIFVLHSPRWPPKFPQLWPPQIPPPLSTRSGA